MQDGEAREGSAPEAKLRKDIPGMKVDRRECKRGRKRFKKLPNRSVITTDFAEVQKIRHLAVDRLWFQRKERRFLEGGGDKLLLRNTEERGANDLELDEALRHRSPKLGAPRESLTSRVSEHCCYQW